MDVHLRCTQNARLMVCVWSTTGQICTYMSARELHGGVAVDVGEQTQAEALRVGRVREPVHRQRGLGGVEGLADTLVQLVVGYRAPEGRLAVGHRLQVWVRGERDRISGSSFCLWDRLILAVLCKLQSNLSRPPRYNKKTTNLVFLIHTATMHLLQPVYRNVVLQLLCNGPRFTLFALSLTDKALWIITQTE